MNNVIIVRQPVCSTTQGLGNSQGFMAKKKVNLSLPPPLEKYVNSADAEAGSKATAVLQPSWHDIDDSQYCSSYMMESQIKDLQVFPLYHEFWFFRTCFLDKLPFKKIRSFYRGNSSIHFCFVDQCTFWSLFFTHPLWLSASLEPFFHTPIVANCIMEC